MKTSLPQSKSDLENCNFSKTILMMLIVLYHSGLYWTGTWFIGTPETHSTTLPFFCGWLNTFHIHAFTLISGYIYYYIRYQRGGYSEPKIFFKNKTRRLLVPYLLTCVFWVIPVSELFFHYSVIELIHKYALGEGPSQLWFILMLFGVSLSPIHSQITSTKADGKPSLLFSLYTL